MYKFIQLVTANNRWVLRKLAINMHHPFMLRKTLVLIGLMSPPLCIGQPPRIICMYIYCSIITTHGQNNITFRECRPISVHGIAART